MGFFKDIEIEIMSWQARGRSQEETYVYFKDYVTQEDVARIFARDCDEETVGGMTNTKTNQASRSTLAD